MRASIRIDAGSGADAAALLGALAGLRAHLVQEEDGRLAVLVYVDRDADQLLVDVIDRVESWLGERSLRETHIRLENGGAYKIHEPVPVA